MATSKPTALCVLLLFFLQSTSSKRTSDLKKEILDLILPKNPNEVLVAPGNATNGATVVEIFTHVLSIDKLNEEKMEFSIRILLRQTWKDDRLKFDGNKGQIKHIVINDPEAIWTPDTFFSNEKKGHNYDITHPNVFIRLYPDGTVLCSRKVSITAQCAVNLKKFPFDKQECGLRIGAYGSTTDDVVLLWRDYVPVTVSRTVDLPLFDLEKFVTYSGVLNINTGEYSYLTLSFYFSRIQGHYLYHTYLPCSMLVILSWIPFWLNKKIITARILTSLASLLTGTLIVYDQNKHQPKLAYSTCMDWFTGTCLTLMFISLIETVIVHVLTENENSGDSKNHGAVNGGVQHKEQPGRIGKVKDWISKISSKTNYIDLGARFVMPLVYVIFCIIFFSIEGGGEGDVSIIRGNQTKETFINDSFRQ